MPTIAVYAGSFDPPTNGHLWMIREASRLFDHLIVAVGVNPSKRSDFSLPERLNMLQNLCFGVGNVEIASFEGKYLIQYCVERGVSHLVRGIRSISDYNYEEAMRHVNEEINSKISSNRISTVFLIPPRDLSHVSSSLIKSLIGPIGWQEIVSRYLPPMVQAEVVRKYEA